MLPFMFVVQCSFTSLLHFSPIQNSFNSWKFMLVRNGTVSSFTVSVIKYGLAFRKLQYNIINISVTIFNVKRQ